MSKTVSRLGQIARGAFRCRRGAIMVEYAMIGGLIVIIAIASLSSFGRLVNSRFTAIASSV